MATDIVPPATAAGDAIPAGVMVAFAGSSAPADWLLCDGSSLLRTTYPDLFAAIGTAFGAVDGTHFNVPDTRGRFLVGIDAATPAWDTLGETGGATSAAPDAHVVTQPNAHVVTQPNDHASHTHTTGAGDTTANRSTTAPTTAVSAITHIHTTGGPSAVLSHAGTAVSAHAGTAVGAHAALATVPPYLTLNYLIKT
jgi:microcystin-dependent protein